MSVLFAELNIATCLVVNGENRISYAGSKVFSCFSVLQEETKQIPVITNTLKAYIFMFNYQGLDPEVLRDSFRSAGGSSTLTLTTLRPAWIPHGRFIQSLSQCESYRQGILNTHWFPIMKTRTPVWHSIHYP